MMKLYTSVVAFILIALSTPAFSQDDNDANSTTQELELYHSPSKSRKIVLTGYEIVVDVPKDSRPKYYGETAYKGNKVQAYNDFWKKDITKEVQEKIKSDIDSLRNDNAAVRDKKMVISSDIQVFYPDVKGFIWGKSFAKVRIHFVVKSDLKVFIDKDFEESFVTSGDDEEFKAVSKTETIEESANITIGIALRMVLDKLYGEMNMIY